MKADRRRISLRPIVDRVAAAVTSPLDRAVRPGLRAEPRRPLGRPRRGAAVGDRGAGEGQRERRCMGGARGVAASPDPAGGQGGAEDHQGGPVHRRGSPGVVERHRHRRRRANGRDVQDRRQRAADHGGLPGQPGARARPPPVAGAQSSWPRCRSTRSPASASTSASPVAADLRRRSPVGARRVPPRRRGLPPPAHAGPPAGRGRAVRPRSCCGWSTPSRSSTSSTSRWPAPGVGACGRCAGAEPAGQPRGRSRAVSPLCFTSARDLAPAHPIPDRSRRGR